MKPCLYFYEGVGGACSSISSSLIQMYMNINTSIHAQRSKDERPVRKSEMRPKKVD